MWAANRATPPLYALTSCKTVLPKDVRGKVRMLTPIMVEVAESHIYEDGTYEGARSIFGYVGQKLIDITERRGEKPIEVEKEAELISVATHIQFIQRYKWKVGIRSFTDASLGFISSPSSIRQLFRDRDVPEGKQRRAAIRNWVSAHYRENPHDESDDIWVRKHLRGIQKFSWNGLEVKVFPPRYEVEQAALEAIKNGRV